MENIIAKQYDIILKDYETKSVTPSPPIKLFVGDSVILNIQVLTKDNLPKDLTGCNVDIKALRTTSNELIEQKFNETTKCIVAIVEPLTGCVRVVLKPNFTSKADKYTLGLNIYDTDENISTQTVVYSVLNTLEGNIIEELENDITTLNKLYNTILQYENELIAIDNDVMELQSLVDLELIKINDKLNQSNISIDNLISALNVKIQNAKDEIDNVISKLNTETLKSYKLKPTIVGEYVYFESDEILDNTSTLPTKGYTVKISGCVSNEEVVHSSVGLLTYYRNINTIYSDYISLLDKSIQGRQVTPTILFDGNIGSVGVKNGYKIVIKTNINKAFLNSANCVLVSLGKVGL